MDCTYTNIDHLSTGYFSSIVIDYLQEKESLRFYCERFQNSEGLEKSIEARTASGVDRQLLHKGLMDQYSNVPVHEQVQKNIDLLLNDNTFTVVTAHQPALFTGTLYFVYKILHAVRLADDLNKAHTDKHFVPVYYMGSEDADLDELNNIYLSGDVLRWDARQQGAVGRMQLKNLQPILNRISGELSVHPFGQELMEILEKCYADGKSVQQATFDLVHTLFARYGLVVFIPDNVMFKSAMKEVFRNDLTEHLAYKCVSDTIRSLGEFYKIQANPREINLFYLKDNIRGRIEKSGDSDYVVVGTDFTFTREQLLQELDLHPEVFSPNVILRGLMQEMLLPNVAFIGGGGELAYWLEYKQMFEAFNVPFPLLMLRNSFILVEEKWMSKVHKLGMDVYDIFKPADKIIEQIVRARTDNRLQLQQEIDGLVRIYEQIQGLANNVDKSFDKHVIALQKRALKPLHELEKKMIRAEKRKFEAEDRQVQSVRKALFPNNNLQERVENFLPYYSKYGADFIDCLYNATESVNPQFRIIEFSDVRVRADV